ncbi:uncharacterized protein LOC132753052, partial [Ruditapes philippinarum]|uniref:uncharacterized protein LOC132753052 n=1 Tax=Ruditapes philippinarum TaxID=129788 RepID=UPI00295A714F
FPTFLQKKSYFYPYFFVIGHLKACDRDFDDLIKGLHEEIRERNYENYCLAEEEQAEVIEEITEVIETAQISTSEKYKVSNDGECDSASKALFQGSPYTLGVTILLICAFIIRFRLPEQAIDYLLKIVSCILPHGHRLMNTLYNFRKFLKEYTVNMRPSLFYYCNFCYCEVNRQCKTCPECSKSLTGSGSMSYFVQLKIEAQLQLLWKNSSFANAVRSHRFKHYESKKGVTSISDIYDGKLYKKLFNNESGILGDENNLSFALNTDGVPLFKSSNIGIWPVYLLINELPISMRKQRDMSIFYGAWISPKKPQMWSFLKPLYEELKVLETEGCECTDSNGKVFTSKCVLLTCTCDLPARALVYNCMQFNGSYSCWYCTDKGETYKFPTGGTCHVFPYNHKKPKNEPRTSETVKSDIASVCENIRSNSKNYIVRGHKGPFWFLYLKHFDAINSCVIDYMHGVCLGVMKTMLTLWFDKSNKDEYFSVFKSKNTVNNILQNIKPTIYVTRMPRSLDNLCHWKSSEFRNFLLYWGVPVLRHILNSDYFVHFCLLVRAIYLLSKENISDNDLKHAEGALLLFVECFQNLYGLRYYTLNLHQLVHLADCVTQTGPLFVNNCFIFEDLNGYIVKHIYGTQGIDNQLINISVMLKVIPILNEKHLKYLENDFDIKQLYAELNDSVDARHTFQDEIEPGIRPIGTVKLVKLNEEEYRIASVYGIDNENVRQFFKVNMYKRGFYVYGTDYKRLQKRQQHVATFLDSVTSSAEFCSVKFFIQSNNINLAFVEIFDKLECFGCVWKVSFTKRMCFIRVDAIINVNNIVTVQDESYICPPPNRYDRD